MNCNMRISQTRREQSKLCRRKTNKRRTKQKNNKRNGFNRHKQARTNAIHRVRVIVIREIKFGSLIFFLFARLFPLWEEIAVLFLTHFNDFFSYSILMTVKFPQVQSVKREVSAFNAHTTIHTHIPYGSGVRSIVVLFKFEFWTEWIGWIFEKDSIEFC